MDLPMNALAVLVALPLGAAAQSFQIPPVTGAPVPGDSSEHTITIEAGRAGQPAVVLNFEEVDVKKLPHLPAADYLSRAGVTLEHVTPGTELRIIHTDNQYGGKALRAPSGSNILLQQGKNAPVRFMLRFARPVKEFRFKRSGLIAADKNGITHPAWRAAGVREDGRMQVVGEDFLGSYADVPARAFVLDQGPFSAVVFASDGHGVAAFGAVVLDDIELVYDDEGRLPLTVQ